MKKRVLDILAIASLVAAAAIATGFFLRCGVMVQKLNSAATAPYYRETMFTFEAGRAAIWIETWQPPPTPPRRPGTHLRILSVSARMPDFRRLFFEFDAHALPGTGGSRMFLLACPIWCLMLLCVIAPALWLLKRAKAETRGFQIVEPKAD